MAAAGALAGRAWLSNATVDRTAAGSAPGCLAGIPAGGGLSCAGRATGAAAAACGAASGTSLATERGPAEGPPPPVTTIAAIAPPMIAATPVSTAMPVRNRISSSRA